MSDIMRRAFISLLGGAAIWPLTARAEKSSALRRVGVVMGFAEDDEVWQTYLKTFRQALQDFGWAEGAQHPLRLSLHRRQRGTDAWHGQGDCRARA